MIDYTYKDLFLDNSIPKQVIISSDNVVLTNEELYNQEMTLEESLCSEEKLIFGSCESSIFKFKISDIFSSMFGKWINVKMIINGNSNVPLSIGRYKVISDKLSSDRRYREIVSYDIMYDILNEEMAAWYNNLLPEKDSVITMKQFRESFIRHFGLTEVIPKGGLVNDGMIVEKTIDPEEISGKDVITAICEINGCFGHIGRDGKFHYIYLPQAIEGLYPANDLYPDHAPEWMVQSKTGHLYPQDPKTSKIGKGSYIPPCNYENFRTNLINKLQIRKGENDIGRIWPDEEIRENDNCYIIQDNFLVYGKSHEQLTPIAKNIFDKITDIVYRPFECSAIGNPCFEVGDPVRLLTKYEIIETYILERTLKGIQALRDTYKSNGIERYKENVNGVHKSIIELKGKTNVLTRTVEETKSEIKDTEKSLRSTITQTAEEIRAEVENTEQGLSSRIIQNAKEIQAEVTRATEEEGKLSASVKIEADRITSEVSRAQNAEGTLSSRITQTESSISAEVERASSAEGNLSSRISITESGISTKVSKGNISSEISQEAGEIDISANRIGIQSDFFRLEKDGTITATAGTIGGMRMYRTSAGQSYLESVPGQSGLTSGIGNSGIWSLWAGYNAATQTASFWVTENGEVHVKDWIYGVTNEYWAIWTKTNGGSRYGVNYIYGDYDSDGTTYLRFVFYDHINNTRGYVTIPVSGWTEGEPEWV